MAMGNAIRRRDYDDFEDDRINSSLRDEVRALRREMRYGKHRTETKKKEKPFNFPFGAKRQMDQSLKAKDKALVIYLTRNGIMEMPKLLPVVSGNLIYTHGRLFELHPKAIWRFGKYNVFIIREIDRLPVSNLDYDKLRKDERLTDNAEAIIKYIMAAKLVPAGPKFNKVLLWIVGIIVVGLVIFFIVKGG